MAQGLFSRLLGGSSARGKRQDDSWRRAQKVGPPNVLESLNPLARGGNDYTLERKRRRNEVQMKFYRPARRKLIGQRQQAKRDLKSNLRRQQEKIERYYGRKERSLGEKRVKEKIKERFRRESRAMERKFDETWRKRKNDLGRQRDRQYRQITREMHEELKKAN